MQNLGLHEGGKRAHLVSEPDVAVAVDSTTDIVYRFTTAEGDATVDKYTPDGPAGNFANLLNGGGKRRRTKKQSKRGGPIEPRDSEEVEFTSAVRGTIVVDTVDQHVTENLESDVPRTDPTVPVSSESPDVPEFTMIPAALDELKDAPQDSALVDESKDSPLASKPHAVSGGAKTPNSRGVSRYEQSAKFSECGGVSHRTSSPLVSSSSGGIA